MSNDELFNALILAGNEEAAWKLCTKCPKCGCWTPVPCECDPEADWKEGRDPADEDYEDWR